MPRFEYEMTYPTNGITTLKAGSLKELADKSGYTQDVIYNKLINNAKRTNILEVKRILTQEAIDRDEKRKEQPKKIIDKDRVKIRTNKKYNFEIEKNDVKKSFSKLRCGAEYLNITPSFMFKILNKEKLRNEYKVTILPIDNII